jgi:MinD-like ATPase involved in chromosome partitioning or flagellar assembly
MTSPLPPPPPAPGPVLAVLAAAGGAGASSFAAALAASRLEGAAPATLIDLDTTGGGLDVLLGLDAQIGARWSDIRLGGGVLDPAALRERLPTRADVAVLACDYGADPSERDVEQVLVAARQLGPVVLDMPRWLPVPARAALRHVDATVVLVPCDVRAVVAAAGLITTLEDLGAQPIAVMRRGLVPMADAARVLGGGDAEALPECAWFRGDRAGNLDAGSIPDRIAEVAYRLWSRIGEAA